MLLLKKIAPHFCLSLMLGAGLLLPMILCLSGAGGIVPGLLSLVIVIAVFIFSAQNKWVRAFTLLAVPLLLIVSALTGSGIFSSIWEVGKAAWLAIAGQNAALPFYRQEFSILLGVILGVLAYYFAKPGSGFLPAALVTALCLFILWLAGRGDLIVWSIPAVLSLLLLNAQSSNDTMPIARAIPLAAIAVAFSFLLTPISGVSYQPLQKKAEELRQTIFDYFFFTEPRNVFSLSGEGYYPLGGSQMGGKAQPSDELVMLVTTDTRVLLRGVVKDTYTGRIWLDSTGSRRYLYISPQWRAYRATLFNEDLPASQPLATSSLLSHHTFTVTMMTSSASTLFVPLRFVSISTSSTMVPYYNASSEVFITRDLAPGDTYTVSAPVAEGGQPGIGTLVKACASAADDNYNTVFNQYTVLPGHLEESLYQLAGKIIADQTEPYDMALSIRQYLLNNYTYNLDVSDPPANVDFVGNFLLADKEGYCTYFASAMTVLCRMVGLPARYVEGYLVEPSGENQTAVTGKNAHAWTEVYFAGYGWLPFDATPGDTSYDNKDNSTSDNTVPPENTPTPPPPEDTPTPQPQNTPTPDPAMPSSSPSPEGSTTPDAQMTPTPVPDEPEAPPEEAPPPKHNFPFWLLVLLAVLALAARIYLTQPVVMARRARRENNRFIVWCDALMLSLALSGWKRHDDETLLVFAQRIDEAKAFHQEVAPTLSSLCTLAYSRHNVSSSETTRCQRMFKGVFAGLNPFKKATFVLKRAFHFSLPIKRTHKKK